MRSKAVTPDVTVVWNEAKHDKVNVKDGPRDKHHIPRSKNNDDEFIPSRIVVDLKLDLGNPSVPEVALDDVHVHITFSGEVPTTIGWWNETKWLKFKHVTYTGNVADITLPSPWPTDPAIGCYP